MSSQITEISELRAELVAVRAEVEALQILFNDRKGQKKESYYQKFLERKLNAKRLYLPDVGITDLTTSDAHIEIKNWDRYQQVPGQLATYQQAAHRARSVVYFFGAMPRFTRVQQIRRLMKRHQIEMLSIDVDDHITSYDILSKQKEICPLDGWLTNNLIRTDEMSTFVHVHRIKAPYERYLKNFNRGLSIPGESILRQTLKEKGYSFANKRQRDKLCPCNNAGSAIKGVKLIEVQNTH